MHLQSLLLQLQRDYLVYSLDGADLTADITRAEFAAVAVKVYDDYVAKTGDKTPTVIASTANPYKFSASVLAAITDEIKADNEFDMVDELFNKSNEPVPQQLATLKGKKPRFTRVSKKEDMKQVVFDMLGI